MSLETSFQCFCSVEVRVSPLAEVTALSLLPKNQHNKTVPLPAWQMPKLYVWEKQKAANPKNERYKLYSNVRSLEVGYRDTLENFLGNFYLKTQYLQQTLNNCKSNLKIAARALITTACMLLSGMLNVEEKLLSRLEARAGCFHSLCTLGCDKQKKYGSNERQTKKPALVSKQ